MREPHRISLVLKWTPARASGDNCRHVDIGVHPAPSLTSRRRAGGEECPPSRHQHVPPMIKERRAAICALRAIWIGMSERGLCPSIRKALFRGPIPERAPEAMHRVGAAAIRSKHLRERGIAHFALKAWENEIVRIARELSQVIEEIHRSLNEGDDVKLPRLRIRGRNLPFALLQIDVLPPSLSHLAGPSRRQDQELKSHAADGKLAAAQFLH